jgi:hypothetical protein
MDIKDNYLEENEQNIETLDQLASATATVTQNNITLYFTDLESGTIN